MNGPPDALEEAIRLFNRKEYFESHDVLEEEWAGARGARRRALKALILVAAGMHHLQTGGLRGARSLLSRSLEILDEMAPEEHLVDPEGFRAPVRSAVGKAARILRGEPVDFGPEDLPAFRRRRGMLKS